MNSKNLSHTIYRDRDILGQTPASAHTVSWQRLGAEDDRAERFEVLLRLLLVLCVGAAMLTCGVWTHEAAPVQDGAVQRVPVVKPARVAAKAAATLLPRAFVRAAQSLR